MKQPHARVDESRGDKDEQLGSLGSLQLDRIYMAKKMIGPRLDGGAERIKTRLND